MTTEPTGHLPTRTSLSGPAAVRTSEPEPPTSVAPAGEDHGATAEPPCPFPMGAKVRRPAYSIPAGSVGEVTDWKQDEDGDWYLAVRYPGVTSLVAVDPENVILVPEVPEPPAGTPVWWDGKWWIKDEVGAGYSPALWAERDTVKFWQFMPGAVPAATPGGDDE